MTINDIIRDYRHTLDNTYRRKLREVRNHIDGYLDGETNVEVVIQIPDLLCEPIRYRSGSGENRLTIDIGRYYVDYTWTRRTFTKRAKDFFGGVVKKVAGFFGSLWGGIKSIGSSMTKAIGWY